MINSYELRHSNINQRDGVKKEGADLRPLCVRENNLGASLCTDYSHHYLQGTRGGNVVGTGKGKAYIVSTVDTC